MKIIIVKRKKYEKQLVIIDNFKVGSFQTFTYNNVFSLFLMIKPYNFDLILNKNFISGKIAYPLKIDYFENGILKTIKTKGRFV